LLLALQSPAFAQAAPPCELHIWPTKAFDAVFLGGTVGSFGYGPVVTGTYLSPMEAVGAKLANSLTDADQEAAIRSLGITSTGKFSGYQLIFHPSPAQSKFADELDKHLGEGGREAESTATCYAELHVVFVRLFRTSLSKKILTGFFYREFGASPTMIRKFFAGGSTGAPAFTANGEAVSEQGRADLNAAFRENVAMFMRKKKMR
jgi:hypothetical protein